MKKYTVISTFAGGGGSSLGYHWAGFKELLAIDFDKNACNTLKANFDFPVWNRDITKVTVNEILEFCKIKIGDLDILDGSPPCQGFSAAGKLDLNDKRNDLYKSFVKLIKGLQPKVFVMENVSNMYKGRYKGKFNEILKELNSIGYKVKCKCMNAMWYGVPQSRERLIFIGVRNDLNKEVVFPIPNKEFITVKQALEGVENKTFYMVDLTKTRRKNMSTMELIKRIKPGRTAQDILGKGKGFNIIRLCNDKPSPVITKTVNNSACLIHPIEDRLITIEELKRLSSFPDDYILMGTFKEQWARIGNAVMPKKMFEIAKTIKENILT